MRMKTYPTPPFTVETAFMVNARPMGVSHFAAGLLFEILFSARFRSTAPAVHYSDWGLSDMTTAPPAPATVQLRLAQANLIGKIHP